MKKITRRTINRIWAVCLTFALLLCCSNATTAYASSNLSYETLVIIDEDGSVSYERVPLQVQNALNLNRDAIVNMGCDEVSAVGISNPILPTASSSSLIPVSPSIANTSPYVYSCLITSFFPNGDSMVSSGTLVSQNIVLASGHGVYDASKGGAAYSVYVAVGAYYDSNGDLVTPYGNYQKRQLILHQDWTSNQLDKADWSLIKLWENYSSHMTYGYSNNYTQSTGRNIKLMGYSLTQFYYSEGTITGTTDNHINTQCRGLWVTSAESTGGMSGGAVIDVASGAVIGVVKGKYGIFNSSNVCVPLNQTVTNAIQTYSNN